MTDLSTLPWRQSRTSTRDVYAQRGPEPSGSDLPVGTLATAELAEEVVAAHNEALARRKAAARGVHGSGWTGVQIGDGGSQTNIF